MADNIKKLSNKPKWTDLTVGLTINVPGSSRYFPTGEWSSVKAHVNKSECRQCLLCAQSCPDSAIPVVDGERVEIDAYHCKGCGICAAVCPFHAIEMKGGK